MKIRTGFVSNSSSSSFVIVLPERPRDTDHLIEMLWPDQKHINSPYGNDNFSVDTAVRYIWDDFQNYPNGNDLDSLIKFLARHHTMTTLLSRDMIGTLNQIRLKKEVHSGKT